MIRGLPEVKDAKAESLMEKASRPFKGERLFYFVARFCATIDILAA